MSDKHAQSVEKASNSHNTGDPGKLVGEAWADLGDAANKFGEASTAAAANAANNLGRIYEETITMAGRPVVICFTKDEIDDLRMDAFANSGQPVELERAAIGRAARDFINENVVPIARSLEQRVQNFFETRPNTRQGTDSAREIRPIVAATSPEGSLGSEGKPMSDRQNNAMMHVIQHLNQLNGDKIKKSNVGEHLIIPPLYSRDGKSKP